jgi:hypothetical protein
VYEKKTLVEISFSEKKGYIAINRRLSVAGVRAGFRMELYEWRLKITTD